MSHESKQKGTQNLGPVSADLHRKLKAKASNDGKSLRALLEEKLGPVVEWVPASKVAEVGAESSMISLN